PCRGSSASALGPHLILPRCYYCWHASPAPGPKLSGTVADWLDSATGHAQAPTEGPSTNEPYAAQQPVKRRGQNPNSKGSPGELVVVAGGDGADVGNLVPILAAGPGVLEQVLRGPLIEVGPVLPGGCGHGHRLGG